MFFFFTFIFLTSSAGHFYCLSADISYCPKGSILRDPDFDGVFTESTTDGYLTIYFGTTNNDHFDILTDGFDKVRFLSCLVSPLKTCTIFIERTNITLNQLELNDVTVYFNTKLYITHMTLNNSHLMNPFFEIIDLTTDLESSTPLYTWFTYNQTRKNIVNFLIDDCYASAIGYNDGSITISSYNTQNNLNQKSIDTISNSELIITIMERQNPYLFVYSDGIPTSAYIPTRIVFSEDISNPEMKFTDNIFEITHDSKTVILLENPDTNLTIYSSQNNIPTNIFETQSTINPKQIVSGYYCLANTEKAFLCSFSSSIEYFTNEPLSAEFIEGSDHTLQFQLALTDETSKPILSVEQLANVSVYFHGYQPSNKQSVLFLTQTQETSNLNFFFDYCTVNLVSVYPVFVEILSLENTIISHGTNFAPIYSLYIDSYSLTFLSMISPITYDERLIDRRIIATGYFNAVYIMLKSIVLDAYSLSYVIPTNMMRNLRIQTSAEIISLDYIDEYTKSSMLEVIPSISITNNTVPVKLIFKFGWDNFLTFVPPIYKGYISAIGNVTFYSENPFWPSEIYDIGDYDVLISRGGKYCFYTSFINVCPEDYLALDSLQEYRLRYLYSDIITNNMSIILCNMDKSNLDIDFKKIYPVNALTIESKSKVGHITIHIMENDTYYVNSLTLNSIELNISSNSTKYSVFSTGNTYIDEKSDIYFHNTKLRTDSFSFMNTKYPTFNNSIIYPEKTALSITIDSDVNQIQIRNTSLILKYYYEGDVVFEGPFLSTTLYLMDTVHYTMLIDALDLAPQSMPAIIPSVSPSLSIILSDRCYDIVSNQKCIISKPQTGTLSIYSSKSYGPTAFLLPIESDSVIYKFQPMQTITPINGIDEDLNKNLVFGIYLGFVAFILITLTAIIYFSISCQKSPELPQDIFNSLTLISPLESALNNET